MKRILVIAPYSYLPYYSGGQKTIAQFVEHLSIEARVTVVSTEKNDAALAKGYNLLRWLPNSFFRYIDLRLYSKLSQLIRSNEFDCVIWIHPYYHWLARLIQKKFGLYTIVHGHNIEYQRFRSTGKWWWPILRLYEGKCLKSADFNYFISPDDLKTAVAEWQLDTTRCDVLPIGITQNQYPADRKQCQQLVRNRHDVPADARILLFNGLLNYAPNRNALDDILESINPRLLTQSIPYRIIVCGKNLDPSYNELSAYQDRSILYAGFVDDIETYFKGADVFLNPVLSGGGVKTKMVEAIGLGTTVVSTQTGATGIQKDVCGEKLLLAEDRDWDDFTNKILAALQKDQPTPDAYYETYHWGNIIQKIPKQLAKQSAG
jgi:glycosyltransferase involved in cell wall biosynthesis